MRNAYEKNFTEAFFPFIFYFLKLIRVFRLSSSDPLLLVSLGNKYEMRGYIPLCHLHANKLFGRHARKNMPEKTVISAKNISTWSSINATRT